MKRAPFRESLGEQLRRCRRMLGLTQRDLAEAVGVKVGWVSSIETERMEPTVFLLLPIIDALLARGMCPHCRGTGRTL